MSNIGSVNSTLTYCFQERNVQVNILDRFLLITFRTGCNASITTPILCSSRRKSNNISPIMCLILFPLHFWRWQLTLTFGICHCLPFSCCIHRQGGSGYVLCCNYDLGCSLSKCNCSWTVSTRQIQVQESAVNIINEYYFKNLMSDLTICLFNKNVTHANHLPLGTNDMSQSLMNTQLQTFRQTVFIWAIKAVHFDNHKAASITYQLYMYKLQEALS